MSASRFKVQKEKKVTCSHDIKYYVKKELATVRVELRGMRYTFIVTWVAREKTCDRSPIKHEQL